MKCHCVVLLTLWPWPLTFQSQNHVTSSISQGNSLHQVWTLWDHSFLSYTVDKQTQQTDWQTDGLERPTHDIVGVRNNNLMGLSDAALNSALLQYQSTAYAEWALCSRDFAVLMTSTPLNVTSRRHPRNATKLPKYTSPSVPPTNMYRLMLS